MGLRKVNYGVCIPSLQEAFLLWALVTDASEDACVYKVSHADTQCDDGHVLWCKKLVREWGGELELKPVVCC